MIRFGIWRLADLRAPGRMGPLARRRPVAVSLYADAAALDDPDRDAILAHILRRFATANGTFKWTASRRLTAFDERVARMIADLAARTPGRRVAVHDMAVSDGRTAVEFFRALTEDEGLDVEFVASDLTPRVTVIDAGGLEVVVDPATGEALQAVRPPFVFNLVKRERALLFPINRLYWSLSVQRKVERIVRRPRDRGPARDVALLAPECLLLERQDPRFSFVRHDIRDRDRDPRDVIRIMNTLNPSYFSEGDIRTVVRSVHGSLRPPGLFVVGSNEEAGSDVNGTVFARTDEGFVVVARAGRGSAIEDLVLRGTEGSDR